jgi:peptidoglycan hydrolase CwlO-like protein
LKKNDEISKSISQLQEQIGNVQASNESEKKELEKVKSDLDRFSK